MAEARAALARCERRDLSGRAAQPRNEEPSGGGAYLLGADPWNDVRGKSCQLELLLELQHLAMLVQILQSPQSRSPSFYLQITIHCWDCTVQCTLESKTSVF